MDENYKLEEIPDQLFRQLLQISGFQESDFKQKFASLTTNLERINFVYEYLRKFNLFPEVNSDAKNDARAVEHRENGNKFFAKGNFLQALEKYTLSVAIAKSKTILALAYANRSACLCNLNLHKPCVTDIRRAFENNYPNEKKEKLINREKEAKRFLNKRAENYYEETPQIMDSQENSLVQCASNCVEIRNNGEFGRHIVATRNIEIGEILSVEKPYACELRSGHLLHCHHCLELCYNLLPCKTCTKALYCSEECQEKALNSYHKYECPILSILIDLKLDTLFSSLRITFLAKEDYNQLSNYHFNGNEYYCSDRYKEIHSLGTPDSKVFGNELFFSTLSASLVFYLVKTKTNFFEDVKIEDVFKEVLLLQIQIASLNGLPICEYTLARELLCYNFSTFAHGIYSFSSLYNHSCCPNVLKSYYGSTLVMRACNTIKKGQQCFISYGPKYETFKKMPRQITLKKNFDFTCKCKACEEDWEAHLIDISQALNLSYSSETLNLKDKVAVANVAFAKKILPLVISLLKRHESDEPFGKCLTLKVVLDHCYKTLANKRRI